LYKYQDNPQIKKYLDLFGGLSLETLPLEVKAYSTNVLKDLLVNNFLKKITIGYINKINHIDLTTETIIKVRREVKDFFTDLEKWIIVLRNLGQVIRSEYDRNHLVVYDEIMETVM
jgi:hypothetical protein